MTHKVLNVSGSHGGRNSVSFSIFKIISKPLILCLFVSVLPGCPVCPYKGQTMDPPAKKVALFDIKGTSGKEFTSLLATNLCSPLRNVVYGDQIGLVEDTIDIPTAASLARQADAQAFIMGTITKEANIDITKYVVRGHFELYDSETGEQIGGVADAEYIHDVDPTIALGWVLMAPIEVMRAIFDPKSESIYLKLSKERREQALAAAPKARQILAECVARELAKGLGENLEKGSPTGAGKNK